MELFTLHGAGSPVDEGSIVLQIEPSDELKGQLEPGWIQMLNEKVCDDFVDTLEDHAEFGEDLPCRVFRVTVRLDEDRDMFIDEQSYSYLETFVDSLEPKKRREFKRIHNEFMEKLVNDFGEYFGKVFNLYEEGGSE